MATQQSTVDDILAHLAGAGRVTARRMFGEVCVYLDEKPVALICNDRFLLKPTKAGRQLVPTATEETPYPGAKLHLVIPADLWADRDAMCRLLRATFAELPKPKPKKPKA